MISSVSGSISIADIPAARDEHLRERTWRKTISWVRLAPLLVAAATFAVAVWALQPYPVGIFHDDGVYLILAKALAGGDGYRYLHLPGSPAATHYPPGYPLLLSALWSLAPSFPRNIELLLAVNVLGLAIAAWGVCRLAQRRLGWPPALAAGAALVGCLSLPMLTLAGALLSEITFLALLVPLLSALEPLLEDEAGASGGRAVAFGTAAGMLALIRTQGTLLIAAAACLLTLRGRWRTTVIFVLAAIVPLVPWQIWTHVNGAVLAGPLNGSYGPYAGWAAEVADAGIGFLARTLMANAAGVAALIADRVAPWTPAAWRILSLTLFLLLLALGAKRVMRRAPLTVTFLAAYVASVLIFPYPPWRYFWAVWPLVLLVVVEGALGTLTARPRWPSWWHWWRWPRVNVPIRVAAAATALLLVTGALVIEVAAYRRRAWAAPARTAAREIAPLMKWVTDHTAPSDLLLADAEPLVYLFTGRRAMPPVPIGAREYIEPATLAAHTRAIADLVSRYPVRYVVTVVPSTRAAAMGLARAAGEARVRLRPVASLPNGAAFVVEAR